MNVEHRCPKKHTTTVEKVAGRYRFLPSCSCGQAFRGYANLHAAELIAQDHANNACD